MIGLTGTADAAARAGHNFNCMEIAAVTVADFFQQSSGIAQSMCDADVEHEAIHINMTDSDAVKAAQLLKFDFFQRVSGS